MSIPMKTIPGYFNEKPGIQVGTKMEGDIRLGSDGRYIFDEQGVRFLEDNWREMHLDRMVTDRLGLSEINKAIQMMLDGTNICKIIIDPTK